MNREQWQNEYDFLRQLYNDYTIAYREYDKGSNEKKRKVGYRNVKHLLQVGKHRITTNEELYNLVTEGNNQYGVIEFFQSRYFGSDLGDLLNKIQKKITTIDN